MSRPFDIRADDLSGPEVAALLREHLESVALHSPPESVHALDLDELRAPEVSFWGAWQGSELVGCGALLELDASHGELKSMRTASAHLRKGVAAALLEHMLHVARERGYRRLSLETGSQEAFAPARALYARFGFESCGPFADYVLDPNSAFMTRALET
jgi:putative acetyltransferase